MDNDKRLKIRIKDVKRTIREYKKELDVARKCEEWGAVEFLCARLEQYNYELDKLMKEYKKESA